MRRAATQHLLAALAVLLGAATAHATTYVPMSDAALVDTTPVVAVGRVVDAAGGPAGTLPATTYRVEVEQVLKGTVNASPVEVRVPGGSTADGHAWRVFGAPSFVAGERVLLFLEPRADGTYGIAQLMLGAFHDVERSGVSMALRDLSEARPVAPDGAVVEGGAEPVRDFTGFADWVRDRAAGRARAVDYRLAESAAASPYGKVTAAFTHMTDGGQCGGGSLPIRWFVFDSGGSVAWSSTGTPAGMGSSGLTELGNALAAWTADPGSDVRLVYQSGGTGGKIYFDDPNGEISGSFAGSGTLAIGGPYFSCSAQSHGGTSYRPAQKGFIVTQDGAGSWFAGHGGKNGEEVFAHELGHTLGFNHSTVSGALMRAYAYGDGRGAHLGADEIAGLAVLYGDGGGGATVPLSPSGLAAVAQSSSTIRLTWTDRSSDETSFRVERSIGGSFATVASLGAGTEATTIGGLAAGTAYVFRVRACNSAGCSGASNQAGATTDPSLPPPSPPAAPSGLSGQATGPTEVRLTWQDRSSNESGFVIEMARAGSAFSALQATGANVTTATVTGLVARTSYAFRVRARNAAGDSAASAAVTVQTPAPPPTCPSGALCLAAGRFEVRVSWRDQHNGGRTGVGRPIPGTAETGYFWFFGPDNVELAVKLLDGRAINGSFWLFYGALTDVAYDIVVTDTVTHSQRTYHNPPGELCGRGDTGAFPVGSGASAGAWLAAPPATAAPAAAAAAACSPTGDVICLAGGRFQVRVEWVNQHGGGQTGIGRERVESAGGDTTGFFWFFSPGNVELLTKLIDGRTVNGHFWFFYGGLSDVDYTLHVRDTWTGKERTYHNAAGELCGRGDTAAF